MSQSELQRWIAFHEAAIRAAEADGNPWKAAFHAYHAAIHRQFLR